MARARLTASAWDATLPLIRADSVAEPLMGPMWGIWTPSTGVDRVLFTGTRDEVAGTLSEGGRVEAQGDRLIITEPFGGEPAPPLAAVTRRCVECGRTFDLTDPVDADEWAYGHDCEA